MSATVSPLKRLLIEREHARAVHRRPAGIAALFLILGIAVACVAWAINNPRTLPDPSGKVHVHRNLSVAKPQNVSMLPMQRDQEASTVHIESVHPRIVENSANADLTFAICTTNYPRDTSRLMPQLADVCTSIEPVDGVDLTIGSGSVQKLVMTVTPHQAGTVSAEGVEVTYSDSWRHGTQRTGNNVSLHFG